MCDVVIKCCLCWLHTDLDLSGVEPNPTKHEALRKRAQYASFPLSFPFVLVWFSCYITYFCTDNTFESLCVCRSVGLEVMNSVDASAGEFEAAVFHADITKLTIHNFLGVL